MLGDGGKYGTESEELMVRFKADMVVLIVGPGGEKGPGFSLATQNPAALLALPSILKNIAAQIEHDVDSLLNPKHQA